MSSDLAEKRMLIIFFAFCFIATILLFIKFLIICFGEKNCWKSSGNKVDYIATHFDIEKQANESSPLSHYGYQHVYTNRNEY